MNRTLIVFIYVLTVNTWYGALYSFIYTLVLLYKFQVGILYV